jgi:hypothetical protein
MTHPDIVSKMRAEKDLVLHAIDGPQCHCRSWAERRAGLWEGAILWDAKDLAPEVLEVSIAFRALRGPLRNILQMSATKRHVPMLRKRHAAVYSMLAL